MCAPCSELRISRLTGLRGCDPPSSVCTRMCCSVVKSSLLLLYYLILSKHGSTFPVPAMHRYGEVIIVPFLLYSGPGCTPKQVILGFLVLLFSQASVCGFALVLRFTLYLYIVQAFNVLHSPLKFSAIHLWPTIKSNSAGLPSLKIQ